MSRGIFVGLVIALLLSVAGNIYLYSLVQQAPEVIYMEPDPSKNSAKLDTPTPEVPAYVVVHISGAVARPNVYTLQKGSRAIAAVEAAGGALATADLERINLARVLVDGEQLHILARGEQPGVTAISPQQPGDTRVNINTATQKELETLPGIGPTKAQDIINYRTQNGPFKSIEDIVKVKGIGEKTFESIKNLIRIG